LSESFDTRKFLSQWKEKKEWLFALGAVTVGLEREGNFDADAEEEIATGLAELGISEKEFRDYVEENRGELLRFLDSSR